MIKHLHKRFTIIYSATIGFIITLMLFFTFLFIRYQLESQTKRILLDTINEIKSKLETDQGISQDWLSKTSANTQILISIEDNATPLLFMDMVQNNTKNELYILVNKVKALALKEGINTSVYPLSLQRRTSSIFSFKGINNKPYYGSISMQTNTKGWQTIILIQPLSKLYFTLLIYGIILILIDLLIILFVYFFSKHFVWKTLQPVINSQQKQKEFIASASHELRSPLALIRAIISSLKMDQAEEFEVIKNNEIDKYMIGLNDIDEETIRMSRLIDDLLLLSSMQTRTWTLNKELFDVETFLIDLYDAFYLITSNHNLNLKLDLQEDTLPSINADKQRLWQVLTILLDNAISYSSGEEDIIIKVYQEEQTLLIEIIDHGKGIPDNHKPYVFDHFYKADSSRGDKNHFGLGLPIAKELIELHNGKITLKDTNGGGTTFVISINIK